MSLLIKPLNENAQVVSRGSEDSAGLDIHAAEKITVPAKSQAIVGTGVALTVVLPENYPEYLGLYIRVAPRSGLAAKNAINVHAGVCDNDYLGEYKVILYNHSDSDLKVNIGDRIAQLIVTPYVKIKSFSMVDELPETARGTGGFGSTGK